MNERKMEEEEEATENIAQSGDLRCALNDMKFELTAVRKTKRTIERINVMSYQNNTMPIQQWLCFFLLLLWYFVSGAAVVAAAAALGFCILCNHQKAITST